MKKITLFFPDTTKLADFIFENVIEKAEVQTSQHKLTAELTAGEIETASSEYGAQLFCRMDS